jgi:hypothetical protein
MGLSVFARTIALEAVFVGDFMVGLTRHGKEIEMPRQPVRFELRAEATVTNVTDARFGPWEKTSPLVTGWIVFDDQGRELGTGELEEPGGGVKEIQRGNELILRAGKLIAWLE